MLRRPRHVPLAAIVAISLLAALVPGAAAHSGIAVGPYVLEIGWRIEPAYVGQPNAIQVTVMTHDTEKPVTDLAADALHVVVSTAAVDSPSLALEPAFDAVEATGPLGEYDAALVPTAPGDYSFHVTGSIHGTAVDLKLASGEETFDPVVGSGDLEFPAKMPTLTEVGTRLDRIDGRVEELQAAANGGDDQRLAALQAAINSAQAAADAANRNALMGLLVGVVGILLALWGARRRSRAA
jgi:hypothetical protein